MNICPKCKKIIAYHYPNCDCPRCISIHNEDKLVFIVDDDVFECPECGHKETIDFYFTQDIELTKAIMGVDSLIEAAEKNKELWSTWKS